MKTHGEVQAAIDAGVSVADLKKIATDFYRWWHNQPGANTDQGFDSWLESIKPKEPELLPCPFCGAEFRGNEITHKPGCYLGAALTKASMDKSSWSAAWNHRRPGDMTREQIGAKLEVMEKVLTSHSGKIDFDEVRRLLTEGR